MHCLASSSNCRLKEIIDLFREIAQIATPALLLSSHKNN
jgi:hypothetical protein